MRLENEKLLRQVLHVDGFRTAIETQSPGSPAGACVKVDFFREQVHLAADAEGRVIDIELAKPRNGFDGSLDKA